MWIKLDVGFASHPKILKAGPRALVLQIRALCYTGMHMTDGFLPAEILPTLILDLPFTGSGDWPSYMVQQLLWDVCEGGYTIHDYLLWNSSRKEIEKTRDDKSKAGKSGMKSRWKKKKEEITAVITSDITPVNNRTITALSYLSSSSSALNSPDPEWFVALKTNPIYAHIDFAREKEKMFVWQRKPANRKRQITETFVINWINKIEPPLTSPGKASPAPQDPLPRAYQLYRSPYPVSVAPEVTALAGTIGKDMPHE